MEKHYLEINEFSQSEITEMFNAICKEIGHITPSDAKKNILGMKGAKEDTSVALTHLMTLIAHFKVEFSFKVTYLKHESVSTKKEHVDLPLDGVENDVVFDAMNEQAVSVDAAGIITIDLPELSEKEKQQTNDLTQESKPTPDKPSFDPSKLPDFKI